MKKRLEQRWGGRPPGFCSFLQVGLLLGLTCIGLAGGNTSIVEIAEVTEIRIEKGKITIVGDAVVRARVMTPKGDHADSSVFGQPAQLVRMIGEAAVFEVVPYWGHPDLEGVPSGGHADAELKKLSEKWWKGTLETAKTIKKGDSITIGYQGDQITISGYQLKKIFGYGSIMVKKSKSK